ncbi:MAG: Ferrous-iron efflux pump FieF [Phycisphaerae bacterium]|nr:Ferrous-iron efflux pump FieF [Phycisphaerae bacterium]
MQQTPSSIRLPTTSRAGYRKVVQVTWVGIVVTLALTAVKMISGWLTGSTALVADGVESLSDSAIALAVIIGGRIAALPADPEHPYGHGKAEVLAAGFIAWFMVMLAVGLGSRGVWQVIHAEELPPPHWAALLFLGGTCIVSESLAQYKLWQARRLNSVALRAEAADHRKDVYSSAIGLVAVGAAIALGGRWVVLDPIAGLITCGFVAWMAVGILREATPQLMDEAVSGGMLRQIRSIAAGVQGVRETEKLIARRSGLDVLVELHVEVDPQMSVADAHVVATAVRDRVVERVDQIADVLVHVEPYYAGDHVNPPAHMETHRP